MSSWRQKVNGQSLARKNQEYWTRVLQQVYRAVRAKILEAMAQTATQVTQGPTLQLNLNTEAEV